MSVSMKVYEFDDETFVLLDEGKENNLLHRTCMVIKVANDETQSFEYQVHKKTYQDTGIKASSKEEACRKAYNFLVEEWANSDPD